MFDASTLMVQAAILGEASHAGLPDLAPRGLRGALTAEN